MIRRPILSLVTLMALAIPATAQEGSRTSDEQIAFAKKVLNDATSTDAALAGITLAADGKAHELAVSYSGVIKGFWINQQCGFLSDEERQQYMQKISLLTNIVGSAILDESGLSMEETGEKTKALQLAARDEVAANRAFDCGPEAAAIVSATFEAMNRIGVRTEAEGPST